MDLNGAQNNSSLTVSTSLLCVDSCPSGYYAQMETNSCEKCAPNCLECDLTANHCTKCQGTSIILSSDFTCINSNSPGFVITGPRSDSSGIPIYYQGCH